jgi:hypothetical protein
MVWFRKNAIIHRVQLIVRANVHGKGAMILTDRQATLCHCHKENLDEFFLST